MGNYKINTTSSLEVLEFLREVDSDDSYQTVSPCIKIDSTSPNQKLSNIMLAGALALFLNSKTPNTFSVSNKAINIEQIFQYQEISDAACFSFDQELKHLSEIEATAAFLAGGAIDIVGIGMDLFAKTTPLVGKELELLSQCIAANSVVKPTLKNRL